MRALLNKIAAPLALLACVGLMFNSNAIAQQAARFFTLQTSGGVELFPAPAALSDTISNPTTPIVGSAMLAWNSTTSQWNRMTVPAAACDDPGQVSSVAISTASSGNVELVALTASQTVYVCGFVVAADGTVGIQFIYGTGTACATGETDLTGVLSLQAREGFVASNGGAVQFKGAVSNALCIELSAAIQVNGVLIYVKKVP